MKIITPATTEPISMTLARLQCRVDADGSPPSHPDDPLIEVYLSTAREWVEDFMGAIVAPTTVQDERDAFPAAGEKLALEGGPVLEVLSVTYTDDVGDPQTVSSAIYTLDTRVTPAVLTLVDGQSWPTDVGKVTAGIKVNYVVGYSSDDDSPLIKPLPAKIKTAILLVLTHFYENRSESTAMQLATIPMGAKSLLWSVRRKLGFA